MSWHSLGEQSCNPRNLRLLLRFRNRRTFQPGLDKLLRGDCAGRCVGFAEVAGLRIRRFGVAEAATLVGFAGEQVVSSRPALAATYGLAYVVPVASEPTMPTLSASEARANLYRLMDQAAESHEPIVISGKRSNAVLIAEEDWSAIQETLHLLSVPGMRESIKAGMAEPTDTCATGLDW